MRQLTRLHYCRQLNPRAVPSTAPHWHPGRLNDARGAVWHVAQVGNEGIPRKARSAMMVATAIEASSTRVRSVCHTLMAMVTIESPATSIKVFRPISDPLIRPRISSGQVCWVTADNVPTNMAMQALPRRQMAMGSAGTLPKVPQCTTRAAMTHRAAQTASQATSAGQLRTGCRLQPRRQGDSQTGHHCGWSLHHRLVSRR